MTPTQAARLLPIIKAFSEGKTIQGKKYNGEWSVYDDPEFSKPPECYRIRPEPQWRPWTMAEINQFPIDTLFKWGINIGVIAFILDGSSATIRCPTFARRVTVYELLSFWTHSTDHGLTWKKCGVEIGEGT